MKKYKWLIIILNLAILLVYFNFSISKKEELLKNGKLILIALAPVDPRSLMQGDYMTLRYSLSEDLHSEILQKRGYCVVKLNKKGVAERQRFQEEKTPLKQDEYLINYTASDSWNVNIGAESFFFQEGHAEKYEKAKYGAVKVDKEGNSLLIGLYNEDLKQIK